MVNKHTVDYYSSPSQLISRTHTFLFLWFIFPESFLDFFLNLYISPWLQKRFKFIVLRLLQIHLWVKNWICSILLMPPSKAFPQVFIIIPRKTEIPHSSWTAFSGGIFSWAERGVRGLWSWKNHQNQQGYWLHVLINSTIFETLTFLVYVFFVQ